MFTLAPISTRNQFGELLTQRGLFGEIAEVGVHRGDFAEALLRGWKGHRLHLIDPWADPEGYGEQALLLRGLGGDGNRSADLEFCRQRLARWRHRTGFVRETSAEAVRRFSDGQLDFVYIDGDHRFAEVLADLQRWWPVVKPGGILAGHDWIQPGETHRWAEQVQDAVAEFVTGLNLRRTNEALDAGRPEPPDIDVRLVVEEGGLPWTYYLEKPQ